MILIQFEDDKLASSTETLAEDVVYEFLVLRIVGFEQIDDSYILDKHQSFVLRQSFDSFTEFFRSSLLCEYLLRYREYFCLVYRFSIDIGDIAYNLSVSYPISECLSYEVKKILSVWEESCYREFCSQEDKFVCRHISEFCCKCGVIQSERIFSS